MEVLHKLRVLAFFVLTGVTARAGALAIPPSYDGLLYPNSTVKVGAPVVVEAFIDPLCNDCKQAWPVITEVLHLYKDSLRLVVHTFPAPFHHNAYFASRALHIASALKPSSTFALLELIFENLDSFRNEATDDETPASVVSRLTDLAVEVGLPRDAFERGFTDTTTNVAAALSFKYGCARYVTETPTFLVSGIAVSADETWSVGQWRELLDPVVASVPRAFASA